jgi:hypothetical protein
MWVPSMDVYMCRWFTTYEEARAAWERIGWDWVCALDHAAWERLNEKREIAA